MMAIQPAEIRIACIEATSQIVSVAIENGKLPAEEGTSVGRYFAELYNWIYASAAGTVKANSLPK